MTVDLDLLVLGSGVAGLSAAVRAAGEHDLVTGVLTKGELDQATTRWAQGGVAAATAGDPEQVDLHLDVPGVVSFGRGPDGEIYVISLQAGVQRIDPA